MSRDYEEYCEECGEYNARRGHIGDNYQMIQCLNPNCGACWLETTTTQRLKTLPPPRLKENPKLKWDNNKTWKEAQSEAYELIGEQNG